MLKVDFQLWVKWGKGEKGDKLCLNNGLGHGGDKLALQGVMLGLFL